MKSNIKNIHAALENKLVAARKAGLKRLANIEHRLEFVDAFDGVDYINDAKSTDINSTWYSIDCLEETIIWIASSFQREEDYQLFGEIDTNKVKALIIMGQAKTKLTEKFHVKINTITLVDSLEEAVTKSTNLAESGDAVLFSPACFDYDSFKHYKEAGQLYRKLVREVQL